MSDVREKKISGNSNLTRVDQINLKQYHSHKWIKVVAISIFLGGILGFNILESKGQLLEAVLLIGIVLLILFGIALFYIKSNSKESGSH